MPTTETKILILLCYFVLLATMITAATTITAQNSDKLIAGFENYFACEAAGTSPKCDSIKEALEPLAAAEIWITVHVLFGIFPAVHLLYVVNFARLQQLCLSWVREKISIPLSTDIKKCAQNDWNSKAEVAV